jgi:hypothetical protein
MDSEAPMTIMSAHKSAKEEDFLLAYNVNVLVFCGLTMSECFITIMSAQHSHRARVLVSLVRDEIQNEACFSSAFVVFSHSLTHSLTHSLSHARQHNRESG